MVFLGGVFLKLYCSIAFEKLSAVDDPFGLGVFGDVFKI